MHSKKQYVKARTSALDLTTCAVLVTVHLVVLAASVLVLELVSGISQPTRSPLPEQIQNYDCFNGFINMV